MHFFHVVLSAESTVEASTRYLVQKKFSKKYFPNGKRYVFG